MSTLFFCCATHIFDLVLGTLVVWCSDSATNCLLYQSSCTSYHCMNLHELINVFNSQRRQQGSPLDLNNLPEEYGKQAVESSTTTAASSAAAPADATSKKLQRSTISFDLKMDLHRGTNMYLQMCFIRDKEEEHRREG